MSVAQELELKCIHVCDLNAKHQEEQQISRFLGFVKKPHYPPGWEYKTDEKGQKYWMCPKCTDEYYKNFEKFRKERQKA